MLKRNPWVAIMVAAAKGNGLHLSVDEVYALSRDGAIEACADNDVNDTLADDEKPPRWKDADPRKYPINKSLSPG